jgi:hypothetical protein
MRTTEPLWMERLGFVDRAGYVAVDDEQGLQQDRRERIVQEPPPGAGSRRMANGDPHRGRRLAQRTGKVSRP